MVRAIQRLRKSGLKVAALTNNFKPEAAPLALRKGMEKDQEEFRSMFDHFIESAVAGMRKPDPAFYRHALQVIGCQPEEVVFLDDIGKNLKPAAEMGILTIHVQNTGADTYLEAVQRLQDAVGVQLLDEGTGSGNSRL
ncbi:unnamed protein product [Polarella glacialis]|uniref:Uncharacterized protein n=1 Tax=Polarella glacialis TaxID=89957 RepID=A0A813G4P7_POLGL|nr:unnamed protein product [Polarella glacialis]